MPELSIITVCLNNARGVRLTAESVTSQSWRNFEWIVKDGGSTDETPRVIAEYHHHMAQFTTGPDAGVFAAMNESTGIARGQWFLFLNSGDALAANDTLEKIAPFLDDPGEQILVGGHFCVWPDGRPPLYKSPRGIMGRDHFYSRSVNHQSAFIGRAVFSRFGPYDTTFRYLADHDFFARAVLSGTTVRCIPEAVAKYDMAGISAQMKHSAAMREEHRRIKARFPLLYRMRRFCADRLAAGVSKGAPKKKSVSL